MARNIPAANATTNELENDMKSKKKQLSQKSELGSRKTPTKPKSIESKPTLINSLEQFLSYRKTKTSSYAALLDGEIVDLGAIERYSEKEVFEALCWNIDYEIWGSGNAKLDKLPEIEEVRAEVKRMIKAGRIKIVGITTCIKIQ